MIRNSAAAFLVWMMIGIVVGFAVYGFGMAFFVDRG